MAQANNFGKNNFQNINNNMNQINNINEFDNPMLNQYNLINPMMNQMGNFNPGIPMLNQMGSFIPGIPMLNQMGNYNQNNPMVNQMNIMSNQMNLMINLMINHIDLMSNQMSLVINQMKSCDQNNSMLNMDINSMNQIKFHVNEIMKIINGKVNKINEKMKEIEEINKEKRKKEAIQNINLNNLNENQKELIDSIIQFYKENRNDYMNFDNPYQIKNLIYFLSLNYVKLDITNNIEDPLYYIKEPKKIIKFINSDYKEYKVNIPKSITKFDLYSIAQKYKSFKNNLNYLSGDYSNILLIYNNLILNRDETSIECIKENDIIIIVEPRNFLMIHIINLYKRELKRKDKQNLFFPQV